MPARIYSHFSTQKIVQPSPAAKPAAGQTSTVSVKQSFTSQSLPGKASNWYKVGGKKVPIYASRKG